MALVASSVWRVAFERVAVGSGSFLAGPKRLCNVTILTRTMSG